VVFELSPDGLGGWTETILHAFVRDGVDGAHPLGPVVFDAAGNLYGGTEQGGTGHVGTVYELTPVGDGTWTETILHNFVHDGTDGAYPTGAVALDAAGNLYGVTSGGGTGRYGTVFELTPGAGGWTETILHNFARDGSDGAVPVSLIMDAAGNLFGTTNSGSPLRHGAVFELSPSGGGTWTESILHGFQGGGPLSVSPSALTLDATGNLYGTTEYGGNTQCPLGCGVVYELSPVASGPWTLTVLHSFQADGVDGTNPTAGVVLDSSGNVFGTTLVGGAYGTGTAFEITR
jgi:uncharacterized repeat protein (TIGR03803 family)